MAVLPVSVVVFAVGFSAGLSQLGGADGSSWHLDEKLGDMELVLKEFEGKLTDLRNGLEEGMEHNRLERSKIRNFVDAIGCMRDRIVIEQKAIRDEVSGNIMVGHVDFNQGGKMLNQKSKGRRRKLGAIASDFVVFFGDLLQESFTSLKQSEGKDANSKVDLIEQAVSLSESKSLEQKEKSFASDMVAETSSDKTLDNIKFEKTAVLSGAVKGSSFENVQMAKMASDQSYKSRGNGKKSDRSRHGIRNNTDMLSHSNELENLNTSFHYMSRQESYRKMVFKQRQGLLMSDEIHNAQKLNNPKASDDMKFLGKTEASSLIEQTLEIHDTLDFHSNQDDANKLKNKQENSKSFMEEYTGKNDNIRIRSEAQSIKKSAYGIEEDRVTVDEEFDQKVKQASELLKTARESMTMQLDEEVVDSMLYKSARLLSEVVDYKPMSLVAIGQLGNTYLLHGELKLKISRELRVLLSKSDTLLNKEQPNSPMKKLDIHILSRENVASALSGVCEECEEFLIKAGRNYRTALEIDGNDVKSLYNWGLALSFRAGLIADIGPEAAVDADKIYMAAIDKFDAIASRSNVYAPDALYRWGIALQERSYLRRQSGEKMKLLLQAKSLFEDVLRMESDNMLVREALSLCLSELRYKGNY